MEFAGVLIVGWETLASRAQRVAGTAGRWGGACALVCICSCGVFSPREPEFPIGLPRDPLRLATIAAGTAMAFTKTERSDIISSATEYVQEPLARETGDRILDRLNEIEQRYDSLYVHWIRDSVETRSDDPRGTLYRMYAVWPDGDSTVADSWRGRAIFRLSKREDLNTWVITRWQDMPLDKDGFPLVGGERSFFHPDFFDSRVEQ